MGHQQCARCGRKFRPRLSFHTRVTTGAPSFFCSQVCRQPVLAGAPISCINCRTPFLQTLWGASKKDSMARCPSCIAAAWHPQNVAEHSMTDRFQSFCFLGDTPGALASEVLLRLARHQAHQGMRVLIIDCDPAARITRALGARAQMTLYDVYNRRCSLTSASMGVGPNMHLVAASEMLFEFERQLVAAHDPIGSLGSKLFQTEGFDLVLFACSQLLPRVFSVATSVAQNLVLAVQLHTRCLRRLADVLRTMALHTGRGEPQALVTALVSLGAPSSEATRVYTVLKQAFGHRVLPRQESLASAEDLARFLFSQRPKLRERVSRRRRIARTMAAPPRAPSHSEASRPPVVHAQPPSPSFV